MKLPVLFKILPVLALAGTVACGEDAAQETNKPDAVREGLTQPPAPVMAETPDMNARRGRLQFITRGCVICHQVNGVGGTAAPDLSAASAPDAVNPLDFSARMWRGAPAMTALQAVELGYVIDLDAQDIADLAAFAASPEEQKLLTEESIPAEMRDWFIDAPHWRSDDWADYLQRGERIPGLDEEDY
ncbi:c-type cytochrome [Hyphococcus luteus]|uniref:c-type cytochrome n=1 Tax=Hyphococcus luteus TaxID=2058213 RepID=UPI001A9CADF0|nr:c-type cytochrome [Marinicaulis flavus]